MATAMTKALAIAMAMTTAMTKALAIAMEVTMVGSSGYAFNPGGVVEGCLVGGLIHGFLVTAYNGGMVGGVIDGFSVGGVVNCFVAPTWDVANAIKVTTKRRKRDMIVQLMPLESEINYCEQDVGLGPRAEKSPYISCAMSHKSRRTKPRFNECIA